MTMHKSTFAYLKPTDAQMTLMDICREAATQYAGVLERTLPEGPDKDFAMRSLRSLAMWVNVVITRKEDGSPRG